MKANSQFGKHVVALVMALVLSLLGRECMAQVNAFTYQGRLTANGSVANGNYDLRFILYTAEIGGSQIGPVLTNSAVAVGSGLFTTTLDFGNGAFTNEARWLEIAVRTTGGGGFTPLNPRQPLMPAPQALYASRAGSAVIASSATAAATASSVPWAGITGIPAGFADGVDDGASFSAGTGLSLAGTTLSLNTNYTDGRYWKLGGNSGTTPGTHFLGTTDNQPLEFKVNNQRALRLEPGDAPNVVGGSVANAVAPGEAGATIAGGGNPLWGANRVESSYSSIGGGYANIILSNAWNSTIGGGGENTIGTNALGSTIAGGFVNIIQTGADSSTISGGLGNIIATDAFQSTIGGGVANTNSAVNGTISGGGFNTIQPGGYSSISGGSQNTIATDANGSTIGGGTANTIGTNAGSSTIGGGSGNTIATDANGSTIGGGIANTIGTNAGSSTIGGGILNTIATDAKESTIGGGSGNTIATNAGFSTIGGGVINTIQTSASSATIGGGESNTNTGSYAAIPGGRNNVASTNAFAAGRRAKAFHTGAFVWGDSTDANIASTNNNSMTFRASGGVRFFSNSGATAGAFLAPSGTSWAAISDRNAKKNFALLDGDTVLEKLASVPVGKWNYKWEPDTATPNIGPMAQDFIAAFYPGRDDKSITTLEFDGVELAAIKALNEKLEKALREKGARVAELERRLGKLESMVLPKTQGAQEGAERRK